MRSIAFLLFSLLLLPSAAASIDPPEAPLATLSIQTMANWCLGWSRADLTFYWYTVHPEGGCEHQCAWIDAHDLGSTVLTPTPCLDPVGSLYPESDVEPIVSNVLLLCKHVCPTNI